MHRRSTWGISTAALALAVACAATPSLAEAQDGLGAKGALDAVGPVQLDKYAYLKRLSLDLRGTTPTWEEYAALETAVGVTEAQIAELLDSDGFLDVMVDYHRDLLWTNVSNFQYIQFPWDLTRVTVGPSGESQSVLYLYRKGAYFRGAPGTSENERIPCGHWPATFDATGMPEVTCEADGTCREGWVWVEPFWDPANPVKVCAFDAMENRYGEGGVDCSTPASRLETTCGCGPNLAFCDARDGAMNVELEIGQALSEQLLQVVRHVIAEDRPYSEVLTTRLTYVNGPIVHYLKNQLSLASIIDVKPSPVDDIFLPDIPFNDYSWYPVLLGDEHSGILTSYGFLLRFQTNRSRVNRFYNAFLDSFFDASRSTGTAGCVQEGADLTKRCYCQNCHLAVEPWAAYWARWKQQGAGYLNPTDFPIFDSACEQCARTGVGSCPTYCRNEYVIETVPADREPYLGYLRGYEFLKPTDMLNTEAGPRLWVERTLQDGTLARGIVSKMWKQFMQRPFDDTKADNDTRDALFATFVGSNYNLKVLVQAIVTHPAYRRIR